MKKFISLVFVLLFSGFVALAQDPTTSWPYLYQDFLDGTVYMKQGQCLQQRMNIHLGHSKVHFLDGQTIKVLSIADVAAIKIGEDSFVPFEGKMLKVEQSSPKGLIASETVGDFAALAETGGAYGTSSTTQSTQRMSSLDAFQTEGQNHMIILQNKHNGQILPLKTKYYLISPAASCRAAKKELTAVFSDRAGEWKAFLKGHKINWNKPESLAQILEFLD